MVVRNSKEQPFPHPVAFVNIMKQSPEFCVIWLHLNVQIMILSGCMQEKVL